MIKTLDSETGKTGWKHSTLDSLEIQLGTSRTYVTLQETRRLLRRQGYILQPSIFDDDDEVQE